jgi:hypothetical protein
MRSMALMMMVFGHVNIDVVRKEVIELTVAI